MNVDDAIRSRRTSKEFGAEPLPRETLDELLELARYAPNHRLTQPWRFRALGPETLARLKAAAGATEAEKLARAPTLVLASCVLTGDPVQDDEDLHATAAAVTIVLLAAESRGLASYWRTPGVLRTAPGRAAVGLPDGERVVGLIHLGPKLREGKSKERRPPADYVSFLP